MRTLPPHGGFLPRRRGELSIHPDGAKPVEAAGEGGGDRNMRTMPPSEWHFPARPAPARVEAEARVETTLWLGGEREDVPRPTAVKGLLAQPDRRTPGGPTSGESMINTGLLARIEAKPEHAAQVQELLENALELARQETQTVTWYAFRLGPTSFGVFDTFKDEAGREAHLNGKIAAALMEIAPTLLAGAPDIQKIDVLAAKLP
nr:hypothetical protein [Streptomyces sp. 2132.2]